MNSDISVREITLADNSEIASIIRSSLSEFGANKPGTVFFDEATDHLFEQFQTPGAIYFIAQEGDTILGGAGIFPSNGLPEKTCELVKMYLRGEARGKGLGRLLIDRCLDFARKSGYEQVYIETMPELRKAVSVYEKFGFEYLQGPLGNTGHFGCDIWMLKRL